MADKPDDGCKESNNKLCPGQLGQQEDLSLAMMEGSVVERRRYKKQKIEPSILAALKKLSLESIFLSFYVI